MNDPDLAGSDDNAIYVTHELLSRPIRHMDLALEKECLLDLANRMANAPQQLLPTFVTRAMAITGGTSAGLSLFDGEGSTLVWTHVKGDLAAFEGLLVPRDQSPSGTAIDQGATVLARFPERHYDWMAMEGLSIPEVLLVPLHADDSDPIGTIWIAASAEGHFHGGHVRALIEIATFVSAALKVLAGIDRLKAAFEQQVVITRELNHRLNNYFTMIDGLVRVSARQTQTQADMQMVLSGHLRTLAQVNAMVTKQKLAMPGDHAVIDLREVLETIIASYPADRFIMTGPAVPCGSQALNGLALIFHELAASAATSGALHHAGIIEIRWQVERDELALSWMEQSDESGLERASEGRSSTLLEAMVGQFGGTLKRLWTAHGVTINMTLKISRLSC